MNADGDARQADAPRPRHRLRWLVTLITLLLAGGVGLHWLSRPQQVSGLILQQAGKALGLVITAGSADYRLRGTPMLELRSVDARQPGAAVPVLTAQRVHIALPWSMIRSRGAQLAIERIELDAPILHLAALQAWLASRPPSDAPLRIPDLDDGLLVRDGRLDAGDWQIEAIRIHVPELHPGQALQGSVAGQYRDAGTKVASELAVTLSEPSFDTELKATGPLRIEQDTWQMQGHAQLSGPLRIADGAVLLAPATFGYSAAIHNGDTRLPLRLGAHGPFGYGDGIVRWGLSSLLLRSDEQDSLIPELRSRGAIAFAKRLVLRLHGQLDDWPSTWPALPPPLGNQTAPLPFALDYVGKANLGDVASLQVRREATTFAARFRLPQVLDWADAPAAGSPLPPLDGRLETPELQIAGATLRGVQITLDDPDISDPSAPAADTATTP